jgi:hypothetical protein
VKQYSEAQLRKRIQHTKRTIPVSRARIRCDIYDRTTNNLIEAKGSTARRAIRMAIGELARLSIFRQVSQQSVLGGVAAQETAREPRGVAQGTGLLNHLANGRWTVPGQCEKSIRLSIDTGYKTAPGNLSLPKEANPHNAHHCIQHGTISLSGSRWGIRNILKTKRDRSMPRHPSPGLRLRILHDWRNRGCSIQQSYG